MSATAANKAELIAIADAVAREKSIDRMIVIEAMEEAIATMLAASDETGAALERFIELNPEFEDMKAGSRLTGSIGRAADAAKNAKARMTRFRLECSIAAADTNQLSLTI